MSGCLNVVPCAAIAAVLFAGSSRLTGQAPRRKRSIVCARGLGRHASGDAQSRRRHADGRRAEYREPARRHDDCRTRYRAARPVLRRAAGVRRPGRAPDGRPLDRQRHGAPLRGARHRRQSVHFGRAARSKPQSRRRARAPASAARRRSASCRSKAGIVSSIAWSSGAHWTIREVYVDADTGEIVRLDQRHPLADRHRTGQRHIRHAQEDEHEPDVVHLSGRRQAASR